MANKQLFNFIPKVIEDLIYQFNADHREWMKPVLLSILSNDRCKKLGLYRCMCCDEPIHINKHRKLDFYFCGVSCYDIVDAERPDHYYHPYIEVLMYGDDDEE
jgi:hypothetical protein